LKQVLSVQISRLCLNAMQPLQTHLIIAADVFGE
jgi:hypothetical protein